jgi:pilus assembly protein Flp/PilA
MNLLNKVWETMQVWMVSFLLTFKRVTSSERGQGMVEYALILALIAVVVIAILTTMGTGIEGKFQKINTELNKP